MHWVLLRLVKEKNIWKINRGCRQASENRTPFKPKTWHKWYSWIYKAAVTLSQSNAQCRTSNHQKQVLFWTKVTLPFVMLRGNSWVFGKGCHLGKGEHRGVQTLLTAWSSVWGYFSYPLPQRPFQLPYLLFLSSCFFAFFSNLGNQYKAIFIVPCLWTEGPMLLAKLMLHFAKKKHCCSCGLPRSKAVSQRGTCNICFCLSLSVWLWWVFWWQ